MNNVYLTDGSGNLILDAEGNAAYVDASTLPQLVFSMTLIEAGRDTVMIDASRIWVPAEPVAASWLAQSASAPEWSSIPATESNWGRVL